MNYDAFLIHAGVVAGIPGRKRQKRFLEAIRNFIQFLQKNRLTRRVLLKEKQQATQRSNVFRSDVTEEGYRLCRAAYARWSEAVEKGIIAPENTEPLAKSLARIRKAKARRKQKPAARGARQTRKAARKKLPRSAKRPSQRTARVVPDDVVEPTAEELTRAETENPHAYDKADWHTEGDYPKDLPEEQAGVHTGMFLGWLIDHDMVTGEFLPRAQPFKRRQFTGPQVYLGWGGVLTSDMLTEEGNRFTRAYYERKFFADYDKLLARGLPSSYHVKDTWENYATLKQQIDKRYAAWKAAKTRKETPDHKAL